MVESKQFVYSKFREDKEAEPGYSREIIGSAVPAEKYDTVATEFLHPFKF
jgi:hypothetical protein